MDSRLIESLKKKKLRVTHARKAIYQILSNSDKSLSVQSVFSKIQKTPGVNTDKVSVYRNLSLFTDLGLVHKFQDGKYSLCNHKHSHSEDHKHLHIIANCGHCGSTYEIDSHDKKLCETASKMKSFVGSFGKIDGITLQGTCKDCI